MISDRSGFGVLTDISEITDFDGVSEHQIVVNSFLAAADELLDQATSCNEECVDLLEQVALLPISDPSRTKLIDRAEGCNRESKTHITHAFQLLALSDIPESLLKQVIAFPISLDVEA